MAEFVPADEVWAQVMVPLLVAKTRAVFAHLVGVQNPVGAQKTAEARRFFEQSGYALYLDILTSSLPEVGDASDIAV